MAQKIRVLTHNTQRRILQLWSFLLLVVLGLMTNLVGCTEDSSSQEYKLLHPTRLPSAWFYPAYGVLPMYGIPVNPDNSTANQKNP